MSKNNEIWKSYTDKRKSWATYRPFRPDYESRKATEDTVKIYIKELLNLKKDNKLELNDIEIISLSAILDEVDYKFAACLMFYPSPVNMIEERIFKADDEKVLVRIVNGLVKYYDVNPFEIEKKT